MDKSTLTKANELNKRINRLDKFVFYAENRWTGKLIQSTKDFIFRSNAYGGLESKEIHLDTELKNKVLDVLKSEMKMLQQELENL